MQRNTTLEWCSLQGRTLGPVQGVPGTRGGMKTFKVRLWPKCERTSEETGAAVARHGRDQTTSSSTMLHHVPVHDGPGLVGLCRGERGANKVPNQVQRTSKKSVRPPPSQTMHPPDGCSTCSSKQTPISLDRHILASGHMVLMHGECHLQGAGSPAVWPRWAVF